MQKFPVLQYGTVQQSIGAKIKTLVLSQQCLSNVIIIDYTAQTGVCLLEEPRQFSTRRTRLHTLTKQLVSIDQHQLSIKERVN